MCQGLAVAFKGLGFEGLAVRIGGFMGSGV